MELDRKEAHAAREKGRRSAGWTGESRMSLIIAMLMLGIIIMIHEFGHFLFAKLNGIGVIEFSLGIGAKAVQL